MSLQSVSDGVSQSSPRSQRRVSYVARSWSLVSVLVLSACGAPTDDEANVGSVAEALNHGNGNGHGHGNGNGHGHGNGNGHGHGHGHGPDGEELFETAFPGTNGRSCASCHVLEEHTVLTPAHVAALEAENPLDPLFNRIDADDPDAEVLTYEHLKKGLVRVILPLPENMDLIDFDGNVVTPPDRTISVWRAVPTVENTAITAPYQYDGRKATLQEQAQGAVTAHSEGGTVSDRDLDAIAEFQEEQFTSKRAEKVAKKMAHGVPPEDIERPELKMKLTEQQERGLEVYNTACEPCHGGSTTLQVVNRTVHDLAFVELKPDGNVLFDSSVTPPVPVLKPQPDNEFLNVGFANLTYLGQIFGDLFGPRFNATVPLPQYRYRFYTDATRTEQVVDLPPVPQTVSGSPFDLRAAVDENGAPIFGPNFLPQLFSTDPGRAAITGDPADYEAFDVPPLRGIINTAPYFHDNSAETLRDAVDLYSRFILPFFAPLNLPAVLPPENGGFFLESLSPEQKDDLMAFLEVL